MIMAAKKKTVAKKPKEKKKAEAGIVTRGKRKESVARAVARAGKGILRVNKFLFETIQEPYAKQIIGEPLLIAGDVSKTVDIDVSVYGGGPMSQAQAVRTAIARALVEFTGDAELKKKMMAYDRSLIVEDTRRVEPKKYKGRKARARFQKSYR